MNTLTVPTPPAAPRGSTVAWTVLIWTGVLLLALMWGGATWLALTVLDLLSSATAAGELTDWKQILQGWQAPVWLAWLMEWLGWDTLQNWREGLAWLLDGLMRTLPWLREAVSWLRPLVWTIWGIGMIGLLLLGAVLQALVRWMVRTG